MKNILYYWWKFWSHSQWRGCSSVVERSLCMWKARGSIPRISNFCPVSNRAVVAEWLRRWTWNPMGSARVGSNPANCDKKFYTCKILPPVGFEPTTPSLRDWCSTTELKRHHSGLGLLQMLLQQGLVGLGVWFALRVREVPGSIPGRARLFLSRKTNSPFLLCDYRGSWCQFINGKVGRVV